MLITFSRERYDLLFDSLVAATQQPNCRFILTAGQFNAGASPALYDLYARFAVAENQLPGDGLICAETYARAVTQFNIYPSHEYLPLSLVHQAPTPNLATPFGAVAESPIWYTAQAVGLVRPHDRLQFMTRGSEIEFWYSPSGFLYLAHQAFLFKTYGARSRRILVFSRSDLSSERFTKLAFLFEAMGIDTILLFDEDVAEFLRANQLDGVDIFSRAGENTFVKMAGITYVSSDPAVADRVAEAQVALVNLRGAHRSVDAYMTAYQAVMQSDQRAVWQRRARTAKSLFERFAILPPAEQRAVLETYIERWRTI